MTINCHLFKPNGKVGHKLRPLLPKVLPKEMIGRTYKPMKMLGLYTGLFEITGQIMLAVKRAPEFI